MRRVPKLWSPSVRKSLKQLHHVAYFIQEALAFARFSSHRAGTYLFAGGTIQYGYKDGGFFPGVNVNGAVHWLFNPHRVERNRRVVLAFDLITEEFREMPLPVKAQEEDYPLNNKYVGNFSGRLCVVNICNEVDNVDIWVMNEYGVASSWSRTRISLMCRSMRLVCSTKNNMEVLMVTDTDMVLYNFKTNESRNLGIRGAVIKFQADTYVESLISSNSYGAEN
ncbi:hypothetical protein Bca4012_060882 [Brassica carinata]